jgi:hypothetical protein
LHLRSLTFSFLARVSDRSILEANLFGSHCLYDGSPNELVMLRSCPSAADGLNLGLERAKRKFIACVHQVVCLPDAWDRCLMQQLQEAERRFGPIGAAGVSGAGEVTEPEDPTRPLGAERIGWVNDRGRVLRGGPELPAKVATLGELLLVVRRDSALRFDPDLGFHLFGADICLQARERGLAVVALCDHNSRSVGLPEAFYRSAAVFARKWSIGYRSPRRA